MIKQNRIPTKPVLVSREQMKRISGDDYVGYSAYRKNKIYIRKGLSKKDMKNTLDHEQGHFRFRRKKVVLGKKVINEIKKTPSYKSFKKEGYRTKKIPEEVMVEAHMAIINGDEGQLKRMKEKAPNVYKKYIQVFGGNKYY